MGRPRMRLNAYAMRIGHDGDESEVARRERGGERRNGDGFERKQRGEEQFSMRIRRHSSEERPRGSVVALYKLPLSLLRTEDAWFYGSAPVFDTERNPPHILGVGTELRLWAKQQ